MRRRMKGALRTRLIGMMVDAGHKLMTVRVVVILAFEVCQVVLRFLCDGARPAR